MITTEDPRLSKMQSDTIQMLHELQIGIHRLGYRQLFVAIPCYALNDSQSLCKELYPAVAEHFGYPGWRPVERAIRVAILAAWDNRNLIVWYKYFPGMEKPPTNKQFIATLAERLK